MSKSERPSSFSRMRSPLRRRKVAHAADLVGGLAAFDAALGDGGMPVRQAVEIAHARPDAVVARVDDGGDVDPRHLKPFRCRVGGGRLRLALGRRCLLADARHIARLADQAAHLGEAAALDADIGQDGIDQRRLHAIAQGRIDHLVGGAAPAAAAAAVEAVERHDADALDLLHRLDALAHDAFDAVEQLAAEQRIARLVAQHVLGFVEQPLRLRLDGGAHARRLPRRCASPRPPSPRSSPRRCGGAWRPRSRAR